MHFEPSDSTPVLHVENDAVVARSVARVLRHGGLSVQRVAGCRDARQLDHCFNVGIFDVDLEDGNGVALAEELTQRGLVRHAIFFTANTDGKLRAQASGVGLVVNKANGATALLDALRDHRNGTSVEASAPSSP